MEDNAYGIGITNRYDFLLDSNSNDPQAILKQKSKKAKKAAKKLAGKENSENDVKVGDILEKVIDEKKVKFVAKGVKQSQPEPAQKSRSMKDMQNIQGNGDGNVNGNTDNGIKESKGNFHRERNYGNNKNLENRENGEPPNRGYRANNGNRNFENRNFENRNNETKNYENRNYENRNNENINNGQDIEYNQRERDNERPARRQGYDRNFGNRDGNRRYDGQRRNFEGRGGKREFDRQSGSDKTGVKAIEKREGGGAHNWGTHKQDIEDLNKNGSEPDLKEDGNSIENAKSEENLEVKPVILTLDEYKTLQGERPKPVFNLRKAGEGEDKKKWKNLVPLKKKEEVKTSEEELDIDMSLYPQRKRSIKYIKDIKVCFNEGKNFGNNTKNKFRKNFDGRNGRNRNDDANRQNAPQLDDQNFPSLG
ncbi:probable serine/threonine-protein kinase clkA [Bradysia coprophila]|uniref:probable serine/threonine-protein kinase clkA n=1 Tax=Bradysia coprophila TaxID=38358 RepID=UPI00187D6FE0|nr:probable serine/threonine-protein kinase clkA [Bradysia coprophila]